MNFYVLKKKIILFYVFPIINKFYLNLDFRFIVDKYRILFCFTVSLITMAVLNFSKRYISEEQFKLRFLFIIFFFVFSIMFLIFSGNFFFLIIGWDGLGVISYLLVIYFFSRKSSNAGILTILRNRVGDIILILCLSVGMVNFRWNILRIIEDTYLRLGLRVIFCLGCFTKSAQIPFSAWLPAAIAAPTPVSSLVHSSTLVTAGIYLIFRFSALINLYIIQFFGLLTIIIAGLNALKEIDMKKIVALSTLSQLGLITCRLGVGLKYCTFFHLILHAYFKALLFIRVGNIIHFSDDYQDLRKINFYENFHSLTLAFSLFANLSLIGFPFFRGFFSKDLILEIFFIGKRVLRFYWFIFWLGCILTARYSFRFFQRVFFFEHKRKSLIFKFYEDKNFIFGCCFLFILRVRGWRWVFWRIFDCSQIILVSLKFKLLIGFILIKGRILILMLEKYRKFGEIFRWGVFSMWSLPLFSKRFLKRSVIKREFFIAYGLDQFIIKERRIFRESYLGEYKREKVNFLKIFKIFLVFSFFFLC